MTKLQLNITHPPRPDVRRKRASWDWKRDRPRVFAPVGVALTTEQRERFTSGYVRATGADVEDAVCDGCGYHLCCCVSALATPHKSCEYTITYQPTAADGERIAREVEKQMRGMYGPGRYSTAATMPPPPVIASRDGVSREFATMAEARAWLDAKPAAEPLPLGWHRSAPLVGQHERYEHASGASVVLWGPDGYCGANWYRYGANGGTGYQADSRAEAMAAALGSHACTSCLKTRPLELHCPGCESADAKEQRAGR